jgi:DNA-binding CsgD family transcriptional regulator
LERDASALTSRWGNAAARRCRGFLAQARGEFGTAEVDFTEAADAFAALGVPLEGARSLLALGALLRRSGQRRRARDVLRRAREVFAGSGAASLVRATDAELGRIGGRVSMAPEELTEAERQVAGLVATGQSNAEVARTLHLSVKTIEAHLSHAYRKLGVRTRNELTALLARGHEQSGSSDR